jgi:hypothetical protein
VLLARLLQVTPSDPREPSEAPPPVEEPPVNQPPEEDAPPPPAAVKTNRQKAAENARAAKAAKAGPVSTGLADLAGPVGTNGAAEDQDDDMGLADPAMSPSEARDQGLAIVREIYAAGKVAEVKALQKEYGVAKFYDVPVEQGHAFHQRVMEVAQSVGLRQ